MVGFFSVSSMHDLACMIFGLTYISFMLDLIFHSWIGDVCETFSYMKAQVVIAFIMRKLELHFLVARSAC